MTNHRAARVSAIASLLHLWHLDTGDRRPLSGAGRCECLVHAEAIWQAIEQLDKEQIPL